MINTETREIDGMNFQVSQLPAMKSVAMLPKLVKLVGPAIKTLAEGGVKSLSDLDMGVIANALLDLVERVDGDEIEKLMKVFFATALVDNKPLLPVFDVVMMGKPFTAYKALGFAIEVNYRAFFEGLRGRASAAAAASSSAASNT